MPKLSVIVCTFNRADSIKDLLNCLASQDIKEAFEVIVVDNNSKDTTRQVVASFELGFNGRLRYFFEPKQGKPYALNLGVKEAKGEILVFTDDDCLVDKNYLSIIYKAFQKDGNEIGLVGGRITPHWVDGNQPPKWFDEIKSDSELKTYFNGPLGTLDYGDKPFVIDFSKETHKDGHFYGANISIRKEFLDKFGYYDTQKTLGQDTEICLRLFRAGVKGIYVPENNVHHKVSAQKITPRFYYRWFYLRGIYRESNLGLVKKFFYPFGIPTWFIRQTIVMYLKSFLKKDQLSRIYARCLVFRNLGEMRSLMRRHNA